MGYTVDIATVMRLAETNYRIAESYAEVTAKIGRTDDAHGHLTDKDGEATAADTELIALIGEFHEYLKTTTSRYYVAAQQLVASAETYVETENEQQDVFNRYADDFEDRYDYELNWDPEEVAADTDRPEEATDAQPEGFGTDEKPAEFNEETKEYLEDLEEDSDDEEGDD